MSNSFETVGELKAFLATVADDTKLAHHTGGNSFSFGSSAEVIKVRATKRDPSYLVGPYKDTFSAANLLPAVDVLTFD